MSEDDVVLGFGPFEMPLLAAAEGASEVMAIAEERWRQAIRDDGDDRDGLDDGRRVKAAPELESTLARRGAMFAAAAEQSSTVSVWVPAAARLAGVHRRCAARDAPRLVARATP